jgi:hypothetical protein
MENLIDANQIEALARIHVITSSLARDSGLNVFSPGSIATFLPATQVSVVYCLVGIAVNGGATVG